MTHWMAEKSLDTSLVGLTRTLPSGMSEESVYIQKCHSSEFTMNASGGSHSQEGDFAGGIPLGNARDDVWGSCQALGPQELKKPLGQKPGTRRKRSSVGTAQQKPLLSRLSPGESMFHRSQK